MPPYVHLAVMDKYTLQVQWDEPFTTQGYPITMYHVSVANFDQTLTNGALNPDTRIYIYSISTESSFTNCTNLTFSVRAENNIGISIPGTINGAFPVSKFSFQLAIIIITNHRNSPNVYCAHAYCE